MAFRNDDWKSSAQAPMSRRDRAQMAATAMVASLDNPDVANALRAAKETRHGFRFEKDLLDTSGERLPRGRQLLQDMAEGRPVEASQARDLMLGIRDALDAYGKLKSDVDLVSPMSRTTFTTIESTFKALPLDPQGHEATTGFTLVNPKDGAQPYYVHTADYHHLDGHRQGDSPIPVEPFVNPDTERFLNKAQVAALEQRMSDMRINAAIALGNSQSSSRG